MRDIHVSAITDTIKKLCMEANWNLGPEMLRAFDNALTTERSAAGKQVLQILKQNAEIARTKRVAYCQDTGVAVCFVELGQDVHVTGGGLYDAINEGVRQGYKEGFLRASMVRSRTAGAGAGASAAVGRGARRIAPMIPRPARISADPPATTPATSAHSCTIRERSDAVTSISSPPQAPMMRARPVTYIGAARRANVHESAPAPPKTGTRLG